jgi:hypothetical protein
MKIMMLFIFCFSLCSTNVQASQNGLVKKYYESGHQILLDVGLDWEGLKQHGNPIFPILTGLQLFLGGVAIMWFGHRDFKGILINKRSKYG